MSIQEDWLKFVITGKVDDYLRYADSCKKENVSGGCFNAVYNRCLGYKGNECGGKRPLGYADDA